MDIFQYGEEGQGLAEYGWSIVLIAIFLIAVLTLLGIAIFDLFDVGIWEQVRTIF